MTALPSGTVTFLFTDIAGSTRLWEEHPDAMQPALAQHDEVVGAAIDGARRARREDHRRRLPRGVHDRARRARRCRRGAGGLADAAWGETGALVVRMGLHTGETQERDGDYYGTAVNRAARLMAVAHGGQVVCSRATVEVAGPAFTTRSLGEHRLRDLAGADEIFQVGDGVFPPLRSVDVVPTNLPTVRTELDRSPRRRRHARHARAQGATGHPHRRRRRRQDPPRARGRCRSRGRLRRRRAGSWSWRRSPTATRW